MRMVLTLDFHNYCPDDTERDDELERIRSMIADDFTSGEIVGSDGRRGWWSFDEDAGEPVALPTTD